MKSIKLIFVITLLFSSLNIFAQGVDIVTLTTSAEGKTKDEAVTTALRNAIEQAFGAFISSKTEIVNDDLIKDEIVSVASGNIQKYDILSSVVLSNGNTAVSVKADVSVTKLTTFAESKGLMVEFKGAAFAANIKLQQLYKENELEAVKNLQTIINEMLSSQFFYDYAIAVSEPKANGNNWKLEYTITITPNKNVNNLDEIIGNTLKALSMSHTEQKDYKAKNIIFRKVIIDDIPANVYYMGNDRFSSNEFYLRNDASQNIIRDIYRDINGIKYRCQVKNGVYTKTLYSRFLKYEDKRRGDVLWYWHVGLLTNYIPTYPLQGYEKYGMCSEFFSIKNNYYHYHNNYSVHNERNLSRDNDSNFAEYRTYNYDPHLYSFVDGDSGWSWLNGSERILSINKKIDAIVTYTEILPLSVLEKIQQFTVEPYIHDEKLQTNQSTKLNNPKEKTHEEIVRSNRGLLPAKPIQLNVNKSNN